MTAVPIPHPKGLRRNRVLTATWRLGMALMAMQIVVLIASLPGKTVRAGSHGLHGFDWALFANQTVVLRLHMTAVILATVLGAVMMAGVKGRRFHRLAGWTWVGLVVIGAVSAVGMGISNQRWDWIQLTVPFVLIVVTAGILAARRHNVVLHRRLMMWQFYGSFVGAGALSFTPGRLMWRFFFG